MRMQGLVYVAQWLDGQKAEFLSQISQAMSDDGSRVEFTRDGNRLVPRWQIPDDRAVALAEASGAWDGMTARVMQAVGLSGSLAEILRVDEEARAAYQRAYDAATTRALGDPTLLHASTNAGRPEARRMSPEVTREALERLAAVGEQTSWSLCGTRGRAMTEDLRDLRWRVHQRLGAEFYRIGLHEYQRLSGLLVDALTRDEIRQVEHDLDELLGVIEHAGASGAQE